MTEPDRIIAIILARAGSKAVPRKNVRDLSGRPLIAWSIKTALDAPSVDRVVVSTDGAEIAGVAHAHGAEVLQRPGALAGDATTSTDVLLFVRSQLREAGETAGIGVLLQPTSPLRSIEDVERCITAVRDEGCDSAATFAEAALHPHRAFRIEDGRPVPFIEDANPWLPRQQLAPPAFELNGAVYAFRFDGLSASSPGVVFGRSRAVSMPIERSVDIDTELDFAVAEQLLR